MINSNIQKTREQTLVVLVKDWEENPEIKKTDARPISAATATPANTRLLEFI